MKSLLLVFVLVFGASAFVINETTKKANSSSEIGHNNGKMVDNKNGTVKRDYYGNGYGHGYRRPYYIRPYHQPYYRRYWKRDVPNDSNVKINANETTKNAGNGSSGDNKSNIVKRWYYYSPFYRYYGYFNPFYYGYYNYYYYYPYTYGYGLWKRDTTNDKSSIPLENNEHASIHANAPFDPHHEKSADHVKSEHADPFNDAKFMEKMNKIRSLEMDEQMDNGDDNDE